MNGMNLAPVALASLLAFSVASTRAQTTTLASVALDAPEGSGSSREAAISGTGRYVAFTSNAANLVPNDTNGQPDIFVRDMVAGTITRVNIDSFGRQTDKPSGSPSISADGRYVAFQSDSADLDVADVNGESDIFVRDTVAGITNPVSIASDGTYANGGSFFASISADGRYVAFESVASNLVPNDTNGALDVFVRDTVAGTTTRVSVGPLGVQANTTSGDPSISANGSRVAFVSYATNLAPNDTNGQPDIFVRDMATGTTILVSVALAKVPGSRASMFPSISADGRSVAFHSDSSNLVPNDTNEKSDVFVRDTVAGTTTRASVTSNEEQRSGDSSKPSISTDGRYVAFQSTAALAPGDLNGASDVFIRDTVAGTTARVSIATDGAPENGDSAAPSISADGRYAAFESAASNLVPSDTNGSADIMVRDIEAGTNARVSVGSSGTMGNNNSNLPSVSMDGRYVAFVSLASNLVLADANATADIFVRDTVTGTTRLVSAASNGAQANRGSDSVSVSADGRYVAFSSDATNLVPGDTNQRKDIFVRDTVSGITTRVSVTSNGLQAGGTSISASISPDGRFVAFVSDATNLVPGDTNGQPDVFVHNTFSAVTTLVSVASNGTQGNGISTSASLSADGRYVAFRSLASNLVSNDTNGSADIFVHDRISGATTRVSVASDGTQGNGGSTSFSLSADGRYVAFHSVASNLVPNDTNGSADVFFHDMVTGSTTLVSVASDGTQGNGVSIAASLSADGRYVAFASRASNLVPGDTNERQDIFVHDTVSGTTTLVSAASDGVQGNRDSDSPSISADGRYVAFESGAFSLVPGDTNARQDVFVRGPLPVAYKTADTLRALRITAGLEGADAEALALLNTVKDGDSDSMVDLRDTVSIARKVAGLEPNPGP